MALHKLLTLSLIILLLIVSTNNIKNKKGLMMVFVFYSVYVVFWRMNHIEHYKQHHDSDSIGIYTTNGYFIKKENFQSIPESPYIFQNNVDTKSLFNYNNQKNYKSPNGDEWNKCNNEFIQKLIKTHSIKIMSLNSENHLNFDQTNVFIKNSNHPPNWTLTVVNSNHNDCIVYISNDNIPQYYINADSSETVTNNEFRGIRNQRWYIKHLFTYDIDSFLEIMKQFLINRIHKSDDMDNKNIDSNILNIRNKFRYYKFKKSQPKSIQKELTYIENNAFVAQSIQYGTYLASTSTPIPVSNHDSDYDSIVGIKQKYGYVYLSPKLNINSVWIINNTVN